MTQEAQDRIIFAILIAAFVFGVGGFVFWQTRATLAQSGGDATPPSVTDVVITQLDASSTQISWRTNELADSMVEYGVDKDYGVVRDPTASTTQHRIVVRPPIPGIKYYFRVISQDAAKNQTVSGDFAFFATGTAPTIAPPQPQKTPEPQKTPPPQVPDSTEGTIPASEDILTIIEKITDPELLGRIAAKIEEIAGRLIAAPVVIGVPQIEIGVERVVIAWETDRDTNGLVLFAPDTAYNPALPNPYITQQGDPFTFVKQHRVELVGLTPAMLYHYQLYFEPDDVGPAGRSQDLTFTTKAYLPEIRGLTVKKIEEHAATLSWVTNVPASALVEYTNLRSRETQTIGNRSFLTNHSIRLPNLEFKTPHIAMVIAENEAGDQVQSRPVTFTTTKDEYPPIISRVSNESTLYPGGDTKVQTVVGWETDEPSTCQFFYHAGLGGGKGEKDESFLPEANPVLRHVQVITSFQPSTIYQFWVVCGDEADNEARSDNFVLFTPEKEKSILDIILENFEGTFGWVKNVGK
ncbi:MAG: fibronectin type III domain-containing protein [bacterium]|nr:fibronectin type III domain-containing protein [bacterium]